MYKKFLLTIPAILILLIATFFAYRYHQARVLAGPRAPEETPLEEITALEPGITTTDQTDLTGPGPTTPEPDNGSGNGAYPNSLTLNIEMPFYTQAPYSNWDYPWQEACEEASVLLVANLYKQLNLDTEAYNTELLSLVSWEVEYFGSYEHTTVDQTAEMLRLRYNLDSEIHENLTFEDIQDILNRGHLIIAPFAGKLLGNPNFRNGGPIYHMLVIKGYDVEKNQIVTHDVGTRNGANYVYDWSAIENALHNWHDDDMLLGDKKIIEVLPPSN